MLQPGWTSGQAGAVVPFVRGRGPAAAEQVGRPVEVCSSPTVLKGRELGQEVAGGLGKSRRVSSNK